MSGNRSSILAAMILASISTAVATLDESEGEKGVRAK